MKKTDQQRHSLNNTKGNRNVLQKKCRYCVTIHEPCRCPGYGNSCSGYGGDNGFEWVCKSPSRKGTWDSNREKCGAVHSMCQDAEEREVSAKDFDMVSWKIF